MEDKTRQEETKIILTAIHFDAIALRYQGNTYKEINKELFNTHGKYIVEKRLRTWFAKGGVLHELYKQYALEETQERRELMHQRLRKLGMRIPDVLEDTLFQPLRNPFTGELLKDANGNVTYIRNKTTNDAVRILAQLLGAKFTDDETGEVKNVLDDYFDRLERMDEKKQKQPEPQPQDSSVPIKP